MIVLKYFKFNSNLEYKKAQFNKNSMQLNV